MTVQDVSSARAGRLGGANAGRDAGRSAPIRARIIAAAVRLLSDDGYAAASTVRIAAAAGVVRGSLLHQFPTRIDLILAVARHTARAQGEFIQAALAHLPPGRERYIGSVDATWAALQRDESRALAEIIMAVRRDPELASRIGDFAERLQASITEGARRLARAAGLRDDHDEAAIERRLVLATLRGLVLETRLTGETAQAGPVIERLKRLRARFYDTHLARAGAEFAEPE